MALVVADRVMETSTSTGTGNFALAGAYTGYRAFDDVCANADTCYYSIEALDVNGNPTGAWEVGLGTFNDTDTLVRTTPAASSNAGAAVDFAAGTKRVMLSASAAYLASLAVTFAVAADYRTGTNQTKALNSDAVWDSAAFVALTDGATVTPDFSAGINFTWTIGGNRTLANPTNAKEGQTGVIQITQDGTGTRLISAYGNNYRFAGGTDIVLSTAASSIDLLFYQVLPSGLIFLTAQKAIAA